MNGAIPNQYVYPGFMEYDKDHCEVHGVPRHRFADGTVICLHCVEMQTKKLLEQPFSYHDNFFHSLHKPFESAWRQLIGAATQAARCAGETAEVSMTRFVVTAAHRLQLETAIIAGRVMTGDISVLLPSLVGAVQG
jgi:hypothetical protein